MPISVQVTQGLLSAAGEQQVLPRIARALLETHGLESNAFMRQNVVGHVVVSEQAASYAGGEAQSLAVVEVKVPSLTFQERATQQRFVEAVTDIIDELKANDHPKSRTFVIVLHAVDGAWGIGGKAYTNADLGAAVAASTPKVDTL